MRRGEVVNFFINKFTCSKAKLLKKWTRRVNNCQSVKIYRLHEAEKVGRAQQELLECLHQVAAMHVNVLSCGTP